MSEPESAVSGASGGSRLLRDYGDAVSPLAVKEWRQGLRSQAFTTPFILFHTLLVIQALLQLDDRSSRGIAGAFWFFLLVLLVLVLPLRSLGAMGEERDGNTLDALLLTSMSPARIVGGKWLATAGLLVVTAVSALPALLVRSLAAGWPLADSLVALASGLVMALALASVFLALSWIRFTLLRIGLAMGLALFVLAAGVVPLLRPLTDPLRAGDLLTAVLPALMVACLAGPIAFVVALLPLNGRSS